ncbi:Nn.00g071240.m01.CDS01 [Neocucurbitaria sp. VM-36]
MDITSGLSSAPHSAYDDNYRRNPPLKIPALGRYRAHNLRISHRISLKQDTVTLHGWPSRGGIIVLESATPPDFDFLHLDPLDPPLRRCADQDAEDVFCQALLRLGATWWDSEARRAFVGKLESFDDEALDAVEADEDLEPTRLESGWVRVAWPSHTPGALCVLACEKLIMGRKGDEKLRPEHYGLVSLARTMDERCTVLQRLGGTMYASIDEFQGPTFLKAWEENHQGEKGPLIKQEFIDPSIYGGHLDDALGKFNTPKLST